MARKKGTQRRAKQPKKPSARVTVKQGQYLAYLYLYRKLHRYSPSESEIAQYFGVSPPSAHQMLVKLEEKGLITREAGVARSVRVTVPREEIPPLEDDEREVPESDQADREEPAAEHGRGRVMAMRTRKPAKTIDEVFEEFLADQEGEAQ